MTLSTTYDTKEGDTFERIATRLYGSTEKTQLIRAANPDVAEPLIPGAVLTVPDTASPAQATGDIDQVSLVISGKQVAYWTEMTLSQSVDSFSRLTLSAPFDASLPDFKTLFRPFSYVPVSVFIGADLVFTGVVVQVSPQVTSTSRTVLVECYAKTALISDCNPSAGSFPVEFNGLTLNEIATRVLAPFSVAPVFEVDGGAAFQRVALKPEQTVFNFLTDLASQRNIVMTSDAMGNTVFTRANVTGSPVARLAEGEQPLLQVLPAFQPQKFYSHITGLETVKLGGSGARYTVRNKHLNGVVRPRNVSVPDGDAKTATEAAAGRMIGSVVTYTVDVVGWRTSEGALFQPNTLLTLVAPSAMIYVPYVFLITDVAFNKTDAQFTATLRLALPGAFSGTIPDTLPWDD